MNRIELEPVDRVRVTVLVDNLTDPLLVDQEQVTRLNWPRALSGGASTRGGTGQSRDTAFPMR